MSVSVVANPGNQAQKGPPRSPQAGLLRLTLFTLKSKDATSTQNNTENPMFNAIHHVALICSDYPASRHFYTQILGMPVIREVYREERQSWKCDLQIGDAELELFSFPQPAQRPSYPEATGLRHLAFAVADIDAAIAWLADHGVSCEPVRRDEHTSKRFTFFRDPDGTPLELYEQHASG